MGGGWGGGGSLVRVSNTAGFGERDSCHERLNHAQLPQLSLQRPPPPLPPSFSPPVCFCGFSSLSFLIPFFRNA